MGRRRPLPVFIVIVILSTIILLAAGCTATVTRTTSSSSIISTFITTYHHPTKSRAPLLLPPPPLLLSTTSTHRCAHKKCTIGRFRTRSSYLRAASTTTNNTTTNKNKNNNKDIKQRTRLVWLTGHADLRLHDHGGFSSAIAAASASDNNSNEIIVPVFVLDPTVHLKCRSESFVRRLHACLSSLENTLSSLASSSPTKNKLSPLVVRTGSFESILPALACETNAVSCHVIGDDVVNRMRFAQKAGAEALQKECGEGLEICRWTNCLRPDALWSKRDGKMAALPSFFPEYCNVADTMEIAEEEVVDWDNFLSSSSSSSSEEMNEPINIPSEGVPPLKDLLSLSNSIAPPFVTLALQQQTRGRPNELLITTEPYEEVVTSNWCTEQGAIQGLEEYCKVGRDVFAERYFSSKNVLMLSKEEDDDNNKGRRRSSMYAQAAARILKNYDAPSKILASRETATRAFSSALKLGALSPRKVASYARRRRKGSSSGGDDNWKPSDDPWLWGRCDKGSLHDVVEWREWFLLLAERSLALQEQGEVATSTGEKIGGSSSSSSSDGEEEKKRGDPREEGRVNYWRWKGQHLVRYLTWPAGKDYYEEQEEEGEVRAPAILLVHGFAASAEQWSRLVHSLRTQITSHNNNNGKDVTPPIYAVDLLGFGHSEKPGLSYTQYLWESQLIDFVLEVMEAQPLILAGNSIGGGISAGAAASLGNKIVRGLVLCNTAGVLEDPDSYTGYKAKNKSKQQQQQQQQQQENTIVTTTYTEAALQGNPNENPYAPVPLFGNKVLDVFGTGIVKLIYPQIEDRLSVIYGNRMENADEGVVYAIQQGAASPGSANVIGSGQKLAPNRPLNEVLLLGGGGGGGGKEGEVVEGGGGFPVLVVMGLDDRVSSPQVAKKRAELFSRLSPGRVVVEEIEDAGHCPHDDAPERVADAMLRWLSTCCSGEI